MKIIIVCSYTSLPSCLIQRVPLLDSIILKSVFIFWVAEPERDVVLQCNPEVECKQALFLAEISDCCVSYIYYNLHFSVEFLENYRPSMVVNTILPL